MEQSKNKVYACEFFINNQSFPGSIVYQEPTNITAYFNVENDELTFDDKYDTLDGRLFIGVEFRLYNAHVSNNGQIGDIKRISYLCEKLLFMPICNNDNLFNKLEFTVENGLSWAEMSLIDTTESDHFTLKLTSIVNREIQLFGSKILFSVDLRGDLFDLGIKEKSTMAQRLSVQIVSDEKQDIDYFLDIQLKILTIITVGVSNNVNILEQTLDGHDLFTTHKNYEIANENKYNFHLNDLINSNSTVKDEMDKLIQILELHATLIRDKNIPAELELLILTQALEAFHEKFIFHDREFNDQVDKTVKGTTVYKQYVQFIKSKFTNQSDTDFLLCKDKKNMTSLTLLMKIRYLLFNNKSLFGKYLASIPEKIVDTRNYYTHHDSDKEIFVDKQLILCNVLLKLLLEYHICKWIGVDITGKVNAELNNLLLS